MSGISCNLPLRIDFTSSAIQHHLPTMTIVDRVVTLTACPSCRWRRANRAEFLGRRARQERCEWTRRQSWRARTPARFARPARAPYEHARAHEVASHAGWSRNGSRLRHAARRQIQALLAFAERRRAQHPCARSASASRGARRPADVRRATAASLRAGRASARGPVARTGRTQCEGGMPARGGGHWGMVRRDRGCGERAV